MELLGALGAILGSGVVATVVSWILNRQQRRLSDTGTEITTLEGLREEVQRWYERWREAADDLTKIGEEYTAKITQLEETWLVKCRELERSLASEVGLRQSLDGRVKRLEQQVRQLGHQPVNGGP